MDHEPPAGGASGPVPQSAAGLALGHVVAGVDDLHHEQVEQPGGDDAAVPGAGEAKSSAGNRQGEEMV